MYLIQYRNSRGTMFPSNTLDVISWLKLSRKYEFKILGSKRNDQARVFATRLETEYL